QEREILSEVAHVGRIREILRISHDNVRTTRDQAQFLSFEAFIAKTELPDGRKIISGNESQTHSIVLKFARYLTTSSLHARKQPKSLLNPALRIVNST